MCHILKYKVLGAGVSLVYAVAISKRHLNISTSRHNKHGYATLRSKLRGLIPHAANKEGLHNGMKEAHKLLGISVRTLERLEVKGELMPFRIGRCVNYVLSDVLAYRESKKKVA